VSIDELIRHLERHKNDHGGSCPVMVSWEGSVRDINPDDIYPEEAEAFWLETDHLKHVLLIDVDAGTK
jgi:hypothetical protein